MKTLYLKHMRYVHNNQRDVYYSNGEIAYEVRSNFFQTKFQILNPYGEILYYINKKRGFRRRFGIYDKEKNEIVELKQKILFFINRENRIIISSDKFENCTIQINGKFDYLLYIGNEKKLEISRRNNDYYREVDIYDLSIESLLISFIFAIMLTDMQVITNMGR